MMKEVKKNDTGDGVFWVYFVVAGPHLYGVSCWIEGKSEGLIERRLPVMSANSGLLLDDPLLGGNVHHVQLDVQI